MPTKLSGLFNVAAADDAAGTMSLTRAVDPTLADKIWTGFGFRGEMINTSMFWNLLPAVVAGAGGYIGGQKHCRSQIRKIDPSFNVNRLPKILGLLK